jgi:ABC-type multidrug transport system fused ATPase/permease subunit
MKIKHDNAFYKILFLLERNDKRKLFFLSFLILLGVLVEMIGTGLLLPTLSVMMNSDIGIKYPIFKPFLNLLGNPNQKKLIILSMITIVIIFTLKSIFLIYLSLYQSNFTTTFTSNLSRKLYQGYLFSPYSFHLDNNSALLLRNFQNITALSAAVQSMINLAVEFSIVSSIFFILILVEPIGTITVTIFLFISIILFQLSTKKKLIKWGTERNLIYGKINQYLLQGLGAIKEIKIFNKEHYFIKQFNHLNLQSANYTKNISVIGLIPKIYLELVSIISLAVLVIVMLLQGAPPNQLITVVGVFTIAAYRMIPSINKILNSLQTIKYSKPIIESINQEFKYFKTLNISPINFKKYKHAFTNTFQLKNITFKYSENTGEILKNISLSIPKGSIIGLIGLSGSGKTTLIDIILGLHKPNSGLILIDNNEINYQNREFNKLIGYVPQAVYLLDDTILKNIAFGFEENEIDYNLLNQSIKLSELDLFINELNDGIDTVIGENGSRLSGGQRQRIGIARALYNNPEILIFDEATSALDKNTEDKILKTIYKYRGDRTIIFITHNESTLKYCDQTYKLENSELCTFNLK